MSAVTEVAGAIGAHVPRLMAEVERRLAVLADGHGPVLARYAGATIAAGGKRLRPLIVFLAAGEAPADTDALVRAAVAVELIHSATLVHDDVLDAAALRRGRPTVVSEAGREMATATGDLLFSRAIAEVAGAGRLDQVRLVSDASSSLAMGELVQRAEAWDVTVPVERYLERCELKTGRLFAAASELGALEGEADPAALAAYGRGIGLAFQLLDDVLDVTGPAQRTGKPRGTDLLDGTVTLPLILARERDPALARLDLREAVRAPGSAEALCDRIEATGAVQSARARAVDMVAQVKAELPPGLPARQRAALELVADGVVERYA